MRYTPFFLVTLAACALPEDSSVIAEPPFANDDSLSTSPSASPADSPPACSRDTDCASASSCSVASCQEGHCRTEAASAGTACEAGRCDEAGYCATGELLWEQQFGGEGTQRIDALSNWRHDVIVAGSFDTQLSFGQTKVATESQQAFAAQLREGEQWERWVPFGALRAQALSASDEGIFRLVGCGKERTLVADLFLDGSIDSVLDNDRCGRLAAVTRTGQRASVYSEVDAAGSESLVVEYFGINGVSLWQRHLQGHGRATALAMSPTGEVIVGGAFFDELGNMHGHGEVDGFVMAFAPDGSALFALPLGGPGDDAVTAIAAGQDSIAVAGHFEQSMSFGDDLTSPNADGFVAQLSYEGTPHWSTAVTGAEPIQLEALAIDALGNVILGGSSTGSMHLGDANASPHLGGFVAKLSQGEPLWLRIIDGHGEQRVRTLTTTPLAVIAGGDFDGAITSLGGGLTSTGGPDAFVMSFAP